MGKCPVCYGSMLYDKCRECGLEVSDQELLELKAETYDDIISHLSESTDTRRREKARCKIALRNISRWASINADLNQKAKEIYKD